jgi:hypothetical protein
MGLWEDSVDWSFDIQTEYWDSGFNRRVGVFTLFSAVCLMPNETSANGS